MPAIHLFGKRTLLGGDDLHVPALATVLVRFVQLSWFVLPLGIYVWKQAVFTSTVTDGDGGGDGDGRWPLWKYLFDWWGEVNASRAAGDEGWDTGTAPCTESFFARYYPLMSVLHLVSTAVFCVHSVSLEYRIWYWSGQGTPTMRQPRTKKVQEFLEFKLGTCTVLLGLVVAGTYGVASACFARSYHRCYFRTISLFNHTAGYDGATDDGGNAAFRYLAQYDDFYDDFYDGMWQEDATGEVFSGTKQSGDWVGSASWYAIGALLAVSQMAEVVVAALYYSRLITKASPASPVASDGLFRSSSFQNDGSNNGTDNHQIVHHELVEELWADRCQSLFRCLSISTCFLFGGHDLLGKSQHAYRHVAQALADYLETKGTLDVVPTDLLTGLLVLQRVQRHRRLLAIQSVRCHENQPPGSLARWGAPSVSTDGNSGGLTKGAVPETITTTVARTTEPSGGHPRDSRSDYHLTTHSPEIRNRRGLRSRGVSNNDSRRYLLNRRSPSPPSGPPPVQQGLDVRGTASVPGNHPAATPLPCPTVQSSTQQQYQQPQQQQHERQKNIYRRRNPSGPSPINGTDSVFPVGASPDTLHNGNGASFYRATMRQILDPDDPVDAATLEEGARMCTYALSIYTWMLYVFVHPVTGFPRLVCRCGSGSVASLGKWAADRCGSCSCRMCSVLGRGQNHRSSFPNSVSMPLNQQRSAGAPPQGGSYDTNTNTQQQQSSFPSSSSSSDLSSSSSSNSSRSRVRSRRGSGVSSDSERGEHYANEARDYGDLRTSGDNLCEWHKRALLLVAGIPEADLVYAQFNNRLSSVPYCILLDHERSLVVVSIRGSLSLEDVVTDTLVLPESLEELGERYGFDGRGQYCHAGVLACFENVLRDLERHGWLERLLEQQYQGYSLRIVGHSLGAGVCTLLGYVLRSKYRSLRVFGFSPPGCTMTWDLATKCAEWSTSFVLDSDIVPRLSVLALEDLRDEVLELIGRIKVPKYKVFQNFLKGGDRRKGCLRGNIESNDDAQSAYYNDDLEKLTQIIKETLYDVPPDTIYQRQLLDFLRVQAERKEVRGETNSRSLRLYPPGRMIHLVKTGEEGGCANMINKCLTCCTSNSGFLYTPVSISNDDLDEIVVNATMGTDHFIDRMCDELHRISNDYLERGGTIPAENPRVGLRTGIV